MQVDRLDIEGPLLFSPDIHADDRGSFLEWFRADTFEAHVGHPFNLAQANASVSGHGTIRGIHFAELPPSQAKYVTCSSGAILDVVVDIRVDSPTFGAWVAAGLDEDNRRMLYIPEGLGHAFIALQEGSVVNYLCSSPYTPGREHEINPFDSEIGIDWPTADAQGSPISYRLSEKDRAAPSLTQVNAAGLLPTLTEARAWTRRQVDASQ